MTPLWLLRLVCNLKCQTYSHSCFRIWELLLCLNRNWVYTREQYTSHVKQFTEKKRRDSSAYSRCSAEIQSGPGALFKGSFLTRHLYSSTDLLHHNHHSPCAQSIRFSWPKRCHSLTLSQCFPNCVPLKRLKCAAKILCFDKTLCCKS